jgi:uncharacterized protein (TIGR03435 family)
MINCGTYKKTIISVIGLIWTSIALIASGQNSSTPVEAIAASTKTTSYPTFDVASVRQNKSDSKFNWFEYTADGVVIRNTDLQTILVLAYDLRDPTVRGGPLFRLIPGAPSWIQSDRFDIQAKLSDSDMAHLKLASFKEQEAQKRLMLQALLEERFALTIRRVATQVPAYDLVIMKNGPKNMKREPDEVPMKWNWTGRSHLSAQATPISALAQPVLTAQLNRPVLDRTGLTGKYDFTLEWTRELDNAAGLNGDSLTSPDNSGPSIFRAVQEQLGLRLEPSTTSAEGIVIDHIEHPSEN